MSGSSSRESTPGPQGKRVARPNPVLKSSEERAKLRRKAFLDRVGSTREDQRWNGKSDQVLLDALDGLGLGTNSLKQILRSDYIAEQRRWQEERQRTAPQAFDNDDFEDQENELPIPSQDMMKTDPVESDSFNMQTMSDEVEAVARQEEQELEELLALAEQENQDPGSERWGSDEEDYDNLFMEYLSSQQTRQQQPAALEGEDEDSMDTSVG